MIKWCPSITAFRIKRVSTYLKHTVYRTRFLWIVLSSIRIKLKTLSRWIMAVTHHFQDWWTISGRIASLEPWVHKPWPPRSHLVMSLRIQASFWPTSKMNRVAQALWKLSSTSKRLRWARATRMWRGRRSLELSRRSRTCRAAQQLSLRWLRWRSHPERIAWITLYLGSSNFLPHLKITLLQHLKLYISLSQAPALSAKSADITRVGRLESLIVQHSMEIFPLSRVGKRP